jgi:hypothetical protein
MRPILPLAALAATAALTAAPALAERLVQPPLKGFAIGTNAGNAQMQLVEMIPTGQTVQNWTQMVTTQRLNGLTRIPAKDFLANMARRVSAGCPRATAIAAPLGSSAGLRIDCPRNPATGKPETTFVRAINGAADLYVIQVAYRSLAMPREAGWARDFLGGVTLVR